MGQKKEDEMETPKAPEVSLVEAIAAENRVEATIPHLIQVRKAAQEKLKTTAGYAVRDALESKLVQEGIQKRSEAAAKVIGKVDEYDKILAGIKPRFLGLGLDGKPKGEAVFTPEEVKLYKETTEKLAKAHTALDLAFGGHDFTKVFELAQKA